jgi:hypothetical protein
MRPIRIVSSECNDTVVIPVGDLGPCIVLRGVCDFYRVCIAKNTGMGFYKKSPYCSSRRKKAKGQTKTKMGGWRDG